MQWPCPGVAHSLTVSSQISQELWPGRGCCLVCLRKERSSIPTPGFSSSLPTPGPQPSSLPHTPAPSLGPSSPRLNTSRLGLLVLFLKVWPLPPTPNTPSSTRATHPGQSPPEAVRTNHRCQPSSIKRSRLCDVVQLSDTCPIGRLSHPSYFLSWNMFQGKHWPG